MVSFKALIKNFGSEKANKSAHTNIVRVYIEKVKPCAYTYFNVCMYKYIHTYHFQMEHSTLKLAAF